MPKPNPNLLAANAAAGYPPPILYLPLSDSTQPGKNLGTGGDFALNGVVARSGRGPSQFNAPYSDLDGASDYLSKDSKITGIADGKQFTLSFNIYLDTTTAHRVLGIASGDIDRFWAGIVSTSGLFEIDAYDSTGSQVLAVITTQKLERFRNYHIVISVDLSNSSNRSLYINGQITTPTWNIYTDAAIDFDVGSNFRNRIGVNNNNTPADYLNGRLGNVFFDTKYIDLSVPANLAKFVAGTGIDAKPADLGANGEKPFGTPPLIYLPMYGNNAGNNYGTGGDFTVNSGPFTGARGPNEFWGNKATFNGTNSYLQSWNNVSTTNGKTFSFSTFIMRSYTNRAEGILTLGSTIKNPQQILFLTSGANIKICAFGTDGYTVLLGEIATNGTMSTGVVYHICGSVDLADSSKRNVYINNSPANILWSYYINSNIDWANANMPTIGTNYEYPNGPSAFFAGNCSELYFTTDYIDFSQEANRLKFRDAFGNPVDLRPQIQAGTLPNPAIYMRFDPSNFGKNSGTGGDFVVNGTITDGGQL